MLNFQRFQGVEKSYKLCYYKSIDENDLENAEKVLSELEKLYPDDPEVIGMRVQFDLEQF